jgi:hypothetical protein
MTALGTSFIVLGTWYVAVEAGYNAAAAPLFATVETLQDSPVEESENSVVSHFAISSTFSCRIRVPSAARSRLRLGALQAAAILLTSGSLFRGLTQLRA